MKNQLAKIAVAMVFSSVSLSAIAQVTLNVGDNTIVTAINGQEIKTGMFGKPQRSFTLDAGKHVITAKYTRLYELRGDNHDILRSSNISLPVELADNQTYTLVMAGQPDGYEQAKAYVKQPKLAILQGGTTIASQQGTEAGGSGIFSGLSNALGGVFGSNNKAVQANQQAIASLEGKSVDTVPALTPAPTAPVATAGNTLDQFMQLWLKASPAEREKIRQWVQQ